MWQKCPICNGRGVITKDYSENNCKTCNGKGIISELTGLSPNGEERFTKYQGVKIGNFTKDFRDNCEQFEDK
jgi:DnaJ-class molecular chaperone